MKDVLGQKMKKQDFITPCSHIGILRSGDVMRVLSINSTCFHIEVCKFDRKNKRQFLEICIDKRLGEEFKVLNVDDIELNINI